ncbi:MAG TPA: hypothetical protein VFS59_11630 [Gemmatimonadaceae bacterium]|nr:hypothetical protein [Gemmatimonadaceae bacterium]
MPEPLSDAQARELLSSYRFGVRDRLVDRLARLVLRAGSKEMQAIISESIRRGVLEWPWPNPPFAEPMEADEPAGEETR